MKRLVVQAFGSSCNCNCNLVLLQLQVPACLANIPVRVRVPVRAPALAHVNNALAHVNNFPIQRMQQLDHLAPTRHPARVRVLPLPLARPPQVQPRSGGSLTRVRSTPRITRPCCVSALNDLALPVEAAALGSACLAVACDNSGSSRISSPVQLCPR